MQSIKLFPVPSAMSCQKADPYRERKADHLRAKAPLTISGEIRSLKLSESLSDILAQLQLSAFSSC